jgi:hypothetical protein
MVRYRLVDDRDGTVLAERASAEQALRLFGPLMRDPHRRVRISVVVLDHELGGMAEVASIGSMQASRHPVRGAGSQ